MFGRLKKVAPRAALVGLFLSTGVQAASLPAPIAHFEFEGTTTDSTRKGFDGIAQNITFVPGVVGTAARFNGSNSMITIGREHPLARGASAFSFSALIRPGSRNGDYNGLVHIVRTERDTSCDQVTFGGIFNRGVHHAFLGISDHRNSCWTGSGGATGGFEAPTGSGEWVHVAATYDGARMQVYLNGAVVNTQNVPGLRVSGGTMLLGFQSQQYPNRFLGDADDLRIYDVALTGAQVKAIYDSYGKSALAKGSERIAEARRQIAAAAAEKERSAREQQQKVRNVDVGDYVCSWRWDGNSGWCGTVEDARGDKLRIEVQKVEVNGYFSTGLNPSDCSGNKRLQYNDKGLLFWVRKSCIDKVR